MPSTNPRIALTVPVHRYDMLKRLAALQGQSMAGVITNILDECYPVLERVCTVMEHAKQAQVTSLAGLREAMEQAEAQLMPLGEQAVSVFDRAIDTISEAAEGGVVRGTRAAPPSVNPRVVTRGSGSQKPPKRAPTSAPGLSKKRGSRS